MPYIIKNKCIYKKNKDGTTGMKVGCTKGDVKKYLKALIINVKENKKDKMKKSNKIKSDDVEHTYIINFKNGSEQSFKKTYKNLLQYINSNEYNIVNIEDIHGNVIWGKNKESVMKKESKLSSIIRKMIKEEMKSNSNISVFTADWNESVEEIFENLKEFLNALGYHVYENPLADNSTMSSILVSKEQLGENEIQAWVDLQDD